jgi:hypothetical protein
MNVPIIAAALSRPLTVPIVPHIWNNRIPASRTYELGTYGNGNQHGISNGGRPNEVLPTSLR